MLADGLRSDYLNITGYSLGCYPAHTPRTSDFSRVFLPTADWTLEEGMVFHMYVSADGIAISETVLVTEAGRDVHHCREVTI
ncbi:Xaa-Pro dipeptidase [Bradyrhizobium daqingense]|uniref:Xaa-Pro dipeptidase n=2 Tax=Bradyrhizobium daqingense TaxID=993502 RepID=A0A562KTH0_9BRAD|nr:Xaa-Pro dipeptidase [Bradyrhizobium daqingense]